MQALTFMSPKRKESCFKREPLTMMTRCEYLARSLGQIMLICGLDDGKIKEMIEITFDCLMDYVMVPNLYGKELRPKLHKREEIVPQLMNGAALQKGDANFFYDVIKYGFSALHCGREESSEAVYAEAAKRTAELYAKKSGLTRSRQTCVENTIKDIYTKFCDTLNRLRNKPPTRPLNICQSCSNRSSTGAENITRGRAYFVRRQKLLETPPINRPLCPLMEKPKADNARGGCRTQEIFSNYLAKNRQRLRKSPKSFKKSDSQKPAAVSFKKALKLKEFHSSKTIQKVIEVLREEEIIKRTKEKVIRLCDEGQQKEYNEVVIKANASGKPYTTRIRQKIIYKPKKDVAKRANEIVARADKTVKQKMKEHKMQMAAKRKEEKLKWDQKITGGALKVIRYMEPDETPEQPKMTKEAFLKNLYSDTSTNSSLNSLLEETGPLKTRGERYSFRGSIPRHSSNIFGYLHSRDSTREKNLIFAEREEW